MTQHTGENGLLYFYLDTMNLSIEEVKEDLINMGIEPDNVTEHFDNIIKKHEAKLKIERSKEIQNRYDQIIKGNSISLIKEKLLENFGVNPDAQFAFNKLDQIDDSDLENLFDDELKLQILKGLGKSNV